jgi:hypothetical protein
MNYHLGLKPFECPYPMCFKKFTEKGNMKTHLKTHKHINEYVKYKLKN